MSKMALVTFENGPNFVGTLLKLWEDDSDHFGIFLRKSPSGVKIVSRGVDDFRILERNWNE
jgi:hypothetical protein